LKRLVYLRKQLLKEDSTRTVLRFGRTALLCPGLQRL
jgi:hypothetical protein